MKPVVATLGLLAAAVTQIGCISHLYSPASRTTMLESSKPLAKDKISTGWCFGGYTEETGLSASHTTLKFRRGMTAHTELGVDANLLTADHENAATDVNPYIWSARVGGKWAPAPLGDYVSLAYGVGGGYSAAGGFVSPDIGIIAAFENRYVVPFLSVDGFASFPINANPVDVSDQHDGPGTDVYTVNTTWGASMTGGLKVPIPAGPVTVSPYLGASYRWLADADENAAATTLSFGADVAF